MGKTKAKCEQKINNKRLKLYLTKENQNLQIKYFR